MGQARSAKQTFSVVAQRGRVYGRALVAAKKIGGRNVSRLALWRADVAQISGLHGRGGVIAGARHRGQHGHLQRGQRRAAQTAALRPPRSDYEVVDYTT